MENLTDLPEEVLMKILGFLPNRMDVAPVCKKFYELICKIDKFKYKMIVGSVRNKVN